MTKHIAVIALVDSLVDYVLIFIDRWELQRKAEAEVNRLRSLGWAQKDFAQELKSMLDGKGRDGK